MSNRVVKIFRPILIIGIDFSNRGNTTLTFDASELIAGIYTYSIIADGKLISTHKMIKRQ
jgi:hypothetical protein